MLATVPVLFHVVVREIEGRGKQTQLGVISVDLADRLAYCGDQVRCGNYLWYAEEVRTA